MAVAVVVVLDFLLAPPCESAVAFLLLFSFSVLLLIDDGSKGITCVIFRNDVRVRRASVIVLEDMTAGDGYYYSVDVHQLDNCDFGLCVRFILTE